MDDDNSLVGQLLADRYALSRMIGRGGMSSVYQAWDTRLERFVAVKMFSVGTASNDSRRESEVKLLARVNHPNLVTLHDAHLAPSGSSAPSYLVMELIEGPDLGARLAQGTMPLAEVAALMTELAEALVTIHDAGVVHRDLKPSNILLAPTGLAAPVYRAKIGDFGIAHLVGAEPLTTVGTVIGTAAYLSPDQAMGQEASPASDIYSLGLLILESITGERAFPGTMIESISARLARDPAIPTELPGSWDLLLSQMTARDPALRPTAAEVVDAGKVLSAVQQEWVGDASADASTQALLIAATGAAMSSTAAPSVPTVPSAAAEPSPAPAAPLPAPAAQVDAPVATPEDPGLTTEAILPPTKVMPSMGDEQPTSATVVMPATVSDPIQAVPAAASRRRDRGTLAALLSLIVATVVAVIVGAGALAGSTSPTAPTNPLPGHTAGTTSHTSTAPTSGTTTSSTPSSTPTPSVTPAAPVTPTKPGPGKGPGPGNGNGNGNGKPHGPKK